ncbi:hypothetical protein PINS_up007755 [Pythium insidiosum]|nr:hypothetical protein PINS_up007755 [Pythium insidiosum]
MGYVHEDNDAPLQSATQFAENYGVWYVRCAQVVEVLDSNGTTIQRGKDSKPKGRTRTFKVAFDGQQYKKDLDDGALAAYEYANLLVRTRRSSPSASTSAIDLHAVAQAIATFAARPTRETDSLPSWLYDLVLGYGDPSAATYESLLRREQLRTTVEIAMNDAFVDGTHALECVSAAAPAHEISLLDASTLTPLEPKDAVAPFTIVENMAQNTTTVKAHRRDEEAPVDASSSSSWRLPPAHANLLKRSLCEGLTVGVGPTGSGKTAIATRIIRALVQKDASRRDEKVLVVVPSDAQADALVERLTALDGVDATGIVRLESASTVFSPEGRVHALLQRRIELLSSVEAIAQWMERVDATKYTGISGSASYSCANALFFYRFHIQALVDQVNKASHSDSEQSPLLRSLFIERLGREPRDGTELQRFVRANVENLFTELERLQCFELLQVPEQRVDAFLIHHARVVVLSSASLASAFTSLSKVRLRFGSVVVDDATQVSELLSGLSLLLASASAPQQLKRVVLLGDRELATQQRSSLLTRWLRLDVNSVSLSPLSMSVTETQGEEPKAATATATVATSKGAKAPAKTPQKKKSKSKSKA